MKYLITAATGRLGREIVTALLKDIGADEIIAGVREPDAAGELRNLGIAVRQADFDKPDTLSRAFSGVDKLVLIPSPAPVVQRFRQHRNVLEAAGAAAMDHVVFISFQDARRDSPLSYAAIFADTEDKLAHSGLRWTVLRMPLYLDSLLDYLRQAKTQGELFASAGEGKVPYLSRRDIAECVRAVLLGDGHAGRIYTLTGPESLSYDDVAALAGEIYGLKIKYITLSPAEHRARLESAGIEEPFIEGALGMAAVQKSGYFDDVTDDVETLLGRPGETARSFLERHPLDLNI